MRSAARRLAVALLGASVLVLGVALPARADPNDAGSTPATAAVGLPSDRLAGQLPALDGQHVGFTSHVSTTEAQTTITLRDASAPTMFRFALQLPAGVALSPDGDGFDVVLSSGRFDTVIGQVAAPWATDATGRSLLTTLSVEGESLVQRVDTTGAAGWWPDIYSGGYCK